MMYIRHDILHERINEAKQGGISFSTNQRICKKSFNTNLHVVVEVT